MKTVKLWLAFLISIALLVMVGKHLRPAVETWYFDLESNAQNIILAITFVGALIGFGLANAFRSICFGIVSGLALTIVAYYVGNLYPAHNLNFGLTCAAVWVVVYFVVLTIAWILRLATGR